MHITINCSECFEIWCSALWQGSCYKCLHQCLRRFFVYKVSDEFPDKRSLIRLKVDHIGVRPHEIPIKKIKQN